MSFRIDPMATYAQLKWHMSISTLFCCWLIAVLQHSRQTLRYMYSFNGFSSNDIITKRSSYKFDYCSYNSPRGTMEQIKKTALLKEKKRKEKEAKIAESLLLSKSSMTESAERAISLTDAPRQMAESSIETTAASTETDSIIVKDLDTNQSETLFEAEKQLNTKYDRIDLPMNVREDFWNCYRSDLSHAEEMFFQACAKGDLVQLDKILDVKSAYPVDINVLSQEGRNCLHVAIGCNGTVQSIRKLIFKGANINHKNKQGRTPLTVAVIRGVEDIVKVLIENKCDLNSLDNYGNTALHYSCMYNHEVSAQLLILYGAKQDIQNLEQQIALQLCGNPKIISLFSKEVIEQDVQKGSEQYGRTVFEEHIRKNSRADHVQKLLSMAEKGRQSLPAEFDQATSFKKKKTNFSRYEAMSKIVSKQSKHVETTLLDFKHVDTLGKGAFGAVYLVEHQHTKLKYALKILSKAQVQAQKLLRYAMTERKILATVTHPFIVKLHYAYQTPDKLIFIMDYCPGGDLLELIRKQKKLSQSLVKKYAAEIVLALEELHKAEIIYRDLKPANVVIDKQGHARLTDFGLAKEADMTHSFCGSLAYLSPEMLSRRGHTRTLDWYLLGVLIYECYTGKPPFYDTNKAQLLENIKIGRYKPFQASPEMKDIMAQLLRSNIQKRLGNQGAGEVKTHPWFKDINWDDVYHRKLEMPLPSSARDILIEKAERTNIFTAEEIEKGKTVNHVKGWEFEA